MSAADPASSEEEVLVRCKRALRLVCAGLPHLSGLAHTIRLKVTDKTRNQTLTPSAQFTVT